ncbi:tyrosine-protein kinase receptor Tie-1-like [Menidia menidia]
MYGPDCKLNCKCQNGGVCNRFRGCQCQTGWRGRNCEKSDRAPQILELDGNIEWNLNSSPQISCSATGNPLPDHKSIDLRKLDGSVLKPTQTTIDSNKSTAVFDIPRMSAQLGGLWECRVSTNGGQDSRRFNITLKEPPVPTTAPKLLQKRSKQLLVMPAESYRGDGPIISTRLIYKPVENGDSWSSIIVYSDKEPITLMNLEPSTRYRVRVQLSRPGQKGEGVPGPEAIMETDCPEPTIQPQIDNSSVEGRSATLRWRLPKNSGIAAGTASGFLVQLFAPPPIKEKLLEETTLLNVLSTKFHNLEYHQDYSVVVRLVNCDSQGPPSEPFHLRINSQGPSSPLNVQATTLSLSAIQVRWRPPENPNGGIVKYVIEYQAVGQESPHPWVDTDDGNKTTKDVTALNSSTAYQFRVRAFSKVPGEWSHFVQAKTQGDGSQILAATTQSVASKPAGEGSQLLEAVVGSVAVTCVTIMLALLVLFFIRKSLLNRRRTFTYQSGSGEETILQFNSGTLTLTRRPKPIPEPLTFPILEWEDIKFEDIIGEGNFGQVIKAMIKKDGNKMSAAIKMLKEFASENDHRDFAGELEVLCKLGQHPNIINLIGACENRGYLYIAIEYAPYGNLLDFLRKSRVLETDPAFAKEHGTASTLTSQQLLQFAVDVATGMHYLSDKQFIHRDLAARNVLVGDNLVAKIADFGLSRGEEVYVKKTMGRLPVRWMAIESLNYSVYTTKSDVWSFGVLLWEIVSLGGTPYCGMTCAELYEKLPQGYRMEKPKNCDDEVYELMRQCWRDRPYERPPFSQISVQLSRMQEARKAYVNMALFENFTYAGIDATAEEA